MSFRTLFSRTLKGMRQATLMWLDAVDRQPKLKRKEIGRRCNLSPQNVTAHISLGACHKALSQDTDLLNRLSMYLGTAVDVSDTTAMITNMSYVGEARYARL